MSGAHRCHTGVTVKKNTLVSQLDVKMCQKKAPVNSEDKQQNIKSTGM